MADRNDKSLPALVSELWQLTLTYLKQETIVPIKNLGRFVLWGAAGAILMAFAVLLLMLGGLRALQTETDGTFATTLSFVPYLIVVAAALVIAAISGSRIGKAKKKGAA